MMKVSNLRLSAALLVFGGMFPILLNMRNVVHLAGWTVLFPAPSSLLEIRLSGKAIMAKGIGDVAQNLKPILLLANATGAVITAHSIGSTPGYKLNKYLRLNHHLRGNRVICPTSRNITAVLHSIASKCDDYPYHELPRLFSSCNVIEVTEYMPQPHDCVARTAPLVRALTRFPRQMPWVKKRDVCVLLRNSDAESHIKPSKSSFLGLDTARMNPILIGVKRRGGHVVKISGTRREDTNMNEYKSEVLSSEKPLETVVKRLMRCRCLFVSSGSSFAATLVQISQPTYIMYTVNHKLYQITSESYPYSEFGTSAHSVLESTPTLIDLCAPASN